MDANTTFIIIIPFLFIIEFCLSLDYFKFRYLYPITVQIYQEPSDTTQSEGSNFVYLHTFFISATRASVEVAPILFKNKTVSTPYSSTIRETVPV